MNGMSHVSYLTTAARESEPIVGEGEDVVLIQELTAKTKIGAYPEERAASQTLLFDVEVGATCRHAGLTDRLSDTIDYAKIVEVIREICLKNRCHLLEALSEEIANTILGQFEAKWVRLTIVKGAIIPGTRHVGVSITRSRRAEGSFRGVNR